MPDPLDLTRLLGLTLAEARQCLIAWQLFEPDVREASPPGTKRPGGRPAWPHPDPGSWRVARVRQLTPPAGRIRLASGSTVRSVYDGLIELVVVPALPLPADQGT